MYFVLQDHDATILRAMNDKCITGVKFDRLAVSRESGHEIGSSTNRFQPTREVVAGLEDRAIDERIEIVLPINQPTQASWDDLALSPLTVLAALIGFVLIAPSIFLCYGFADRLARMLGPTAMLVITKPSSFLPVCIGVQIGWNGVKALLESVALHTA